MLQGNTLRITSDFSDFDGAILTPENVKVILYDAGRVKIETIVPIYDSELGKYVSYIKFEKPGSYYIEVYGEKNSMAILERRKIQIAWSN